MTDFERLELIVRRALREMRSTDGVTALDCLIRELVRVNTTDRKEERKE